MADQAASRAMLQDMGLTEAAADAIIYDDQGMDDIEKWGRLSHQDLKLLTSTTRKPGGGDDGHSISFLAAKNMGIMLTKI